MHHPCVLPCPSRPSHVRFRGHEPNVMGIARATATLFGTTGHPLKKVEQQPPPKHRMDNAAALVNSSIAALL